MQNPTVSKLILLFAGTSAAGIPFALADHGPGTSGGGASTQSAETLKPRAFSVDLRTDFTEFENLSDEQVDANAAAADEFDLLDRSFLSSISVGYGVVENFQVNLTLGHYTAVNARSAEFEPGDGEAELHTFDPDGLTDLWLDGKYRFYRGPLGSVAVLGGVKFPTGKHDVRNSAGERIEPSATAGSGSYDGRLGLAYSRFLTSQLTLDASGLYTFRTEADHFKLGDRVDAGVALAYRFTEDIKQFPQFSAFGELNLRHLMKSEEDGEKDPHTGGTVLFLTPGVRVGFCPNFSFTASAPLPAAQDPNGVQLETDYKINGALTFTF